MHFPVDLPTQSQLCGSIHSTESCPICGPKVPLYSATNRIFTTFSLFLSGFGRRQVSARRAEILSDRNLFHSLPSKYHFCSRQICLTSSRLCQEKKAKIRLLSGLPGHDTKDMRADAAKEHRYLIPLLASTRHQREWCGFDRKKTTSAVLGKADRFTYL